MKRCPTCNRSYADDAQRFCLDDGATLLEEPSAPFDPQATLAMPGAMPTSPPSNPYGSGTSGSGQSQQPPPPPLPTPSWTPPQSTYSPSASAAPKRKVWPWLLGGAAVLIFGFIGLVVILVLAFGDNTNANNSNSNSNRANTNTNGNTRNSNTTNTNTRVQTGTPITSTDGHSQITVPSGWVKSTELNDKASIQVANAPAHLYLIVLTDDKANYSRMSLEQHSTQTLNALTNAATNPTKTGPTNLTINGNPAVQYEVRGEVNSVYIVYLHTTVETDEHFQQIIGWTVQSEYDEKKGILQDIVRSFKDLE